MYVVYCSVGTYDESRIPHPSPGVKCFSPKIPRLMLIKVLCVGWAPELWGKDKPVKDQRHVKRLNLVDCDTFCQVKDTFDYVPSKDEEERIDFDKITMATFTLGVSAWDKEHGRLKATRGKIDLGTVPAALIKSPGSSEAVPLEALFPQGRRDNGKAVTAGMSAGAKSPAGA